MTVKFDRVVVVVIDGLGIGSAPDAAHFADQGADTLGRLVSHFRARLQLPTLTGLGLGELHPLFGPAVPVNDHVYYGQARPAAIGKTPLETGWELLGVPTTEEFTALPQGLSPTLLAAITRYAKRLLIGNQPATPRSVLARWGGEQVATGGVIVFTSGGSDLWLTAHESTVPVAELRRLGHFTRQLLDQQPGVNLARVVAVPFRDDPLQGYAYRSAAGAELTMAVPGTTLLDQLQSHRIPVRALAGGRETFAKLGPQLARQRAGVWLTHLRTVDQAGARRNPEQMGQCLAAVDQALGELLPVVSGHDLLVVTAGHGNDPDFPGRQVTREWVPVLAYSPALVGGRLADRTSLADVTALILENYGLSSSGAGVSFLNLLR